MANMHWCVGSDGVAQMVALFSIDDQKNPEVFIQCIGPRRETDYRHLVFIGIELSNELSAALVAFGYHGSDIRCDYRSLTDLQPGEFRDEEGSGEILLIVPETPAGVLSAIKAANARLNYRNIGADIAAFMSDCSNLSGVGLKLEVLWDKKFPTTKTPKDHLLPKEDARACVDFLKALENFVHIVIGVCGGERLDAYMTG